MFFFSFVCIFPCFSSSLFIFFPYTYPAFFPLLLFPSLLVAWMAGVHWWAAPLAPHSGDRIGLLESVRFAVRRRINLVGEDDKGEEEGREGSSWLVMGHRVSDISHFILIQIAFIPSAFHSGAGDAKSLWTTLGERTPSLLSFRSPPEAFIYVYKTQIGCRASLCFELRGWWGRGDLEMNKTLDSPHVPVYAVLLKTRLLCCVLGVRKWMVYWG